MLLIWNEIPKCQANPACSPSASHSLARRYQWLVVFPFVVWVCVVCVACVCACSCPASTRLGCAPCTHCWALSCMNIRVTLARLFARITITKGPEERKDPRTSTTTATVTTTRETATTRTQFVWTAPGQSVGWLWTWETGHDIRPGGLSETAGHGEWRGLQNGTTELLLVCPVTQTN